MSQVDDRLTALDKIWPYWWLEPPRSAKFFDYLGRFGVVGVDNEKSVELCKGNITKSQAGVYYFTAHSYTFDGTTEEIDEPGAITGQLYWFPQIDGRPAIKGKTVYPNDDGYIGAPGAPAKQEGYNETFGPGRYTCDPPAVLVAPSQNFSLKFTIIDGELGKPIPEGGNRFVQGRITGWAVDLPPQKRKS
jgi:hypothetical protein